VSTSIHAVFREETYRECEVQLQLHVSKAKNPTHGHFCHVSLFAPHDANGASFLASCRNTLCSQPIAHSDPSSRSHCHLQGESLPKTRPQDSLPSNMAESTNNDYTNGGCSMIPRPKLNASCGRGTSCVLPKLHSTHFTTRNIPYHVNGQAARASTCLVNSFTNVPTYLLFNPLL
jgi:hypothetical protein